MPIVSKTEALRMRPLRDVLQVPELRGARLAESIKCADTNQIQHFRSGRAGAVEEIAQCPRDAFRIGGRASLFVMDRVNYRQGFDNEWRLSV